MGILSNFFNKSKKQNICTNKNSQYYGYPNDLKEYCEYQDKYGPLWNIYGEYKEKINYYYYNYINNKNHNDFNNLLIYCQKYNDILPQIEKAKEEDTKINGTIYKKDTYSIVHHRLAMAYEKAECYNSAINICNEAIAQGYTDGTKGGFESRLERLKKKQNKAMH